MLIRSSTKESILLSLEDGTRMYIDEDIENRIGTIAIMVSKSVDKELNKSSIILNINKSNESFNLTSEQFRCRIKRFDTYNKRDM